jgi:hypothetical protein
MRRLDDLDMEGRHEPPPPLLLRSATYMQRRRSLSLFSIVGVRHRHARGGTTRTDALQKLPLLSFVNGCNVPDLEIAPVRKGRFGGLPP